MQRPSAMAGRYFSFCASVAKSRIAWLQSPMVVEKRARNTAEARVKAKVSRTCCSWLRPSPPYSSGIEMAKRRISRMRRTRSSGTWPSSSTRSSFGISSSRVNASTSARYASKSMSSSMSRRPPAQPGRTARPNIAERSRFLRSGKRIPKPRTGNSRPAYRGPFHRIRRQVLTAESPQCWGIQNMHTAYHSARNIHLAPGSSAAGGGSTTRRVSGARRYE